MSQREGRIVRPEETSQYNKIISVDLLWNGSFLFYCFVVFHKPNKGLRNQPKNIFKAQHSLHSQEKKKNEIHTQCVCFLCAWSWPLTFQGQTYFQYTVRIWFELARGLLLYQIGYFFRYHKKTCTIPDLDLFEMCCNLSLKLLPIGTHWEKKYYNTYNTLVLVMIHKSWNKLQLPDKRAPEHNWTKFFLE